METTTELIPTDPETTKSDSTTEVTSVETESPNYISSTLTTKNNNEQTITTIQTSPSIIKETSIDFRTSLHTIPEKDLNLVIEKNNFSKLVTTNPEVLLNLYRPSQNSINEIIMQTMNQQASLLEKSNSLLEQPNISSVFPNIDLNYETTINPNEFTLSNLQDDQNKIIDLYLSTEKISPTNLLADEPTITQNPIFGDQDYSVNQPNLKELPSNIQELLHSEFGKIASKQNSIQNFKPSKDNTYDSSLVSNIQLLEYASNSNPTNPSTDPLSVTLGNFDRRSSKIVRDYPIDVSFEEASTIFGAELQSEASSVSPISKIIDSEQILDELLTFHPDSLNLAMTTEVDDIQETGMTHNFNKLTDFNVFEKDENSRSIEESTTRIVDIKTDQGTIINSHNNLGKEITMNLDDSINDLTEYINKISNQPKKQYFEDANILETPKSSQSDLEESNDLTKIAVSEIDSDVFGRNADLTKINKRKGNNQTIRRFTGWGKKAKPTKITTLSIDFTNTTAGHSSESSSTIDSITTSTFSTNLVSESTIPATDSTYSSSTTETEITTKPNSNQNTTETTLTFSTNLVSESTTLPATYSTFSSSTTETEITTKLNSNQNTTETILTFSNNLVSESTTQPATDSTFSSSTTETGITTKLNSNPSTTETTLSSINESVVSDFQATLSSYKSFLEEKFSSQMTPSVSPKSTEKQESTITSSTIPPFNKNLTTKGSTLKVHVSGTDRTLVQEGFTFNETVVPNNQTTTVPSNTSKGFDEFGEVNTIKVQEPKTIYLRATTGAQEDNNEDMDYFEDEKDLNNLGDDDSEDSVFVLSQAINKINQIDNITKEVNGSTSGNFSNKSSTMVIPGTTKSVDEINGMSVNTTNVTGSVPNINSTPKESTSISLGGSTAQNGNNSTQSESSTMQSGSEITPNITNITNPDNSTNNISTTTNITNQEITNINSTTQISTSKAFDSSTQDINSTTLTITMTTLTSAISSERISNNISVDNGSTNQVRSSTLEYGESSKTDNNISSTKNSNASTNSEISKNTISSTIIFNGAPSELILKGNSGTESTVVGFTHENKSTTQIENITSLLKEITSIDTKPTVEFDTSPISSLSTTSINPSTASISSSSQIDTSTPPLSENTTNKSTTNEPQTIPLSSSENFDHSSASTSPSSQIDISTSPLSEITTTKTTTNEPQKMSISSSENIDHSSTATSLSSQIDTSTSTSYEITTNKTTTNEPQTIPLSSLENFNHSSSSASSNFTTQQFFQETQKIPSLSHSADQNLEVQQSTPNNGNYPNAEIQTSTTSTGLESIMVITQEISMPTIFSSIIFPEIGSTDVTETPAEFLNLNSPSIEEAIATQPFSPEVSTYNPLPEIDLSPSSNEATLPEINFSPFSNEPTLPEINLSHSSNEPTLPDIDIITADINVLQGNDLVDSAFTSVPFTPPNSEGETSSEMNLDLPSSLYITSMENNLSEDFKPTSENVDMPSPITFEEIGSFPNTDIADTTLFISSEPLNMNSLDSTGSTDLFSIFTATTVDHVPTIVTEPMVENKNALEDLLHPFSKYSTEELTSINITGLSNINSGTAEASSKKTSAKYELYTNLGTSEGSSEKPSTRNEPHISSGTTVASSVKVSTKDEPHTKLETPGVSSTKGVDTTKEQSEDRTTTVITPKVNTTKESVVGSTTLIHTTITSTSAKSSTMTSRHSEHETTNNETVASTLVPILTTSDSEDLDAESEEGLMVMPLSATKSTTELLEQEEQTSTRQELKHHKTTESTGQSEYDESTSSSKKISYHGFLHLWHKNGKSTTHSEEKKHDKKKTTTESSTIYESSESTTAKTSKPHKNHSSSSLHSSSKDHKITTPKHKTTAASHKKNHSSTHTTSKHHSTQSHKSTVTHVGSSNKKNHKTKSSTTKKHGITSKASNHTHKTTNDHDSTATLLNNTTVSESSSSKSSLVDNHKNKLVTEITASPVRELYENAVQFSTKGQIGDKSNFHNIQNSTTSIPSANQEGSSSSTNKITQSVEVKPNNTISSIKLEEINGVLKEFEKTPSMTTIAGTTIYHSQSLEEQSTISSSTTTADFTNHHSLSFEDKSTSKISQSVEAKPESTISSINLAEITGVQEKIDSALTSTYFMTTTAGTTIHHLPSLEEETTISSSTTTADTTIHPSLSFEEKTTSKISQSVEVKPENTISSINLAEITDVYEKIDSTIITTSLMTTTAGTTIHHLPSLEEETTISSSTTTAGTTIHPSLSFEEKSTSKITQSVEVKPESTISSINLGKITGVHEKFDSSSITTSLMTTTAGTTIHHLPSLEEKSTTYSSTNTTDTTIHPLLSFEEKSTSKITQPAEFKHNSTISSINLGEMTGVHEEVDSTLITTSSITTTGASTIHHSPSLEDQSTTSSSTTIADNTLHPSPFFEEKTTSKIAQSVEVNEPKSTISSNNLGVITGGQSTAITASSINMTSGTTIHHSASFEEGSTISDTTIHPSSSFEEKSTSKITQSIEIKPKSTISSNNLGEISDVHEEFDSTLILHFNTTQRKQQNTTSTTIHPSPFFGEENNTTSAFNTTADTTIHHSTTLEEKSTTSSSTTTVDTTIHPLSSFEEKTTSKITQSVEIKPKSTISSINLEAITGVHEEFDSSVIIHFNTTQNKYQDTTSTTIHPSSSSEEKTTSKVTQSVEVKPKSTIGSISLEGITGVHEEFDSTVVIHFNTTQKKYQDTSTITHPSSNFGENSITSSITTTAGTTIHHSPSFEEKILNAKEEFEQTSALTPESIHTTTISVMSSVDGKNGTIVVEKDEYFDDYIDEKEKDREEGTNRYTSVNTIEIFEPHVETISLLFANESTTLSTSEIHKDTLETKFTLSSDSNESENKTTEEPNSHSKELDTNSTTESNFSHEKQHVTTFEHPASVQELHIDTETVKNYTRKSTELKRSTGSTATTPHEEGSKLDHHITTGESTNPHLNEESTRKEFTEGKASAINHDTKQTTTTAESISTNSEHLDKLLTSTEVPSSPLDMLSVINNMLSVFESNNSSPAESTLTPDTINPLSSTVSESDSHHDEPSSDDETQTSTVLETSTSEIKSSTEKNMTAPVEDTQTDYTLADDDTAKSSKQYHNETATKESTSEESSSEESSSSESDDEEKTVETTKIYMNSGSTNKHEDTSDRDSYTASTYSGFSIFEELTKNTGSADKETSTEIENIGTTKSLMHEIKRTLESSSSSKISTIGNDENYETKKFTDISTESTLDITTVGSVTEDISPKKNEETISTLSQEAIISLLHSYGTTNKLDEETSKLTSTTSITEEITHEYISASTNGEMLATPSETSVIIDNNNNAKLPSTTAKHLTGILEFLSTNAGGYEKSTKDNKLIKTTSSTNTVSSKEESEVTCELCEHTSEENENSTKPEHANENSTTHGSTVKSSEIIDIISSSSTTNSTTLVVTESSTGTNVISNNNFNENGNLNTGTLKSIGTTDNYSSRTTDLSIGHLGSESTSEKIKIFTTSVATTINGTVENTFLGSNALSTELSTGFISSTISDKSTHRSHEESNMTTKGYISHEEIVGSKSSTSSASITSGNLENGTSSLENYTNNHSTREIVNPSNLSITTTTAGISETVLLTTTMSSGPSAENGHNFSTVSDSSTTENFFSHEAIIGSSKTSTSTINVNLENGTSISENHTNDHLASTSEITNAYNLSITTATAGISETVLLSTTTMPSGPSSENGHNFSGILEGSTAKSLEESNTIGKVSVSHEDIVETSKISTNGNSTISVNFENGTTTTENHMTSSSTFKTKTPFPYSMITEERTAISNTSGISTVASNLSVLNLESTVSSLITSIAQNLHENKSINGDSLENGHIFSTIPGGSSTKELFSHEDIVGSSNTNSSKMNLNLENGTSSSENHSNDHVASTSEVINLSNLSITTANAAISETVLLSTAITSSGPSSENGYIVSTIPSGTSIKELFSHEDIVGSSNTNTSKINVNLENGTSSSENHSNDHLASTSEITNPSNLSITTATARTSETALLNTAFTSSGPSSENTHNLSTNPGGSSTKDFLSHEHIEGSSNTHTSKMNTNLENGTSSSGNHSNDHLVSTSEIMNPSNLSITTATAAISEAALLSTTTMSPGKSSENGHILSTIPDGTSIKELFSHEDIVGSSNTNTSKINVNLENGTSGSENHTNDHLAGTSEIMNPSNLSITTATAAIGETVLLSTTFTSSGPSSEHVHNFSTIPGGSSTKELFSHEDIVGSANTNTSKMTMNLENGTSSFENHTNDHLASTSEIMNPSNLSITTATAATSETVLLSTATMSSGQSSENSHNFSEIIEGSTAKSLEESNIGKVSVSHEDIVGTSKISTNVNFTISVNLENGTTTSENHTTSGSTFETKTPFSYSMITEEGIAISNTSGITTVGPNLSVLNLESTVSSLITSIAQNLHENKSINVGGNTPNNFETKSSLITSNGSAVNITTMTSEYISLLGSVTPSLGFSSTTNDLNETVANTLSSKKPVQILINHTQASEGTTQPSLLHKIENILSTENEEIKPLLTTVKTFVKTLEKNISTILGQIGEIFKATTMKLPDDQNMLTTAVAGNHSTIPVIYYTDSLGKNLSTEIEHGTPEDNQHSTISNKLSSTLKLDKEVKLGENFTHIGASEGEEVTLAETNMNKTVGLERILNGSTTNVANFSSSTEPEIKISNDSSSNGSIAPEEPSSTSITEVAVNSVESTTCTCPTKHGQNVGRKLTTPTPKEIYINLPTFFPNSTIPIPNFEKYYSTENSSDEVIDDELTYVTFNVKNYKMNKLRDFDFITEFESSENLTSIIQSSVSFSAEEKGATQKIDLGADNKKLICNLDNNNRKTCLCSVDKLVNDLQEKSKGKQLNSTSNYMCEVYIPMTDGIKVGKPERKAHRRRKRSLDFFSRHVKRQVIQNTEIEGSLAKDFEFSNTDVDKYAQPGSTVRIPCAEGKNMSTTYYTIKWTANKGEPLTEGKIEETGSGFLIIENLVPQDGGNYTCTVTNNSTGIRTFKHQLFVITLPKFDVNTSILYDMKNNTCQTEDVEVLQLYFTTEIANLICGKEHKICSAEVNKIECVKKDNKTKDLLYISLIYRIEPMDIIIPSLNNTICDVVCQMKVYAKLVSVIVNNLEVFETQPVMYHQGRDVVMLPSHEVSTNLTTESPKLIIGCPPGFGLMTDKHICLACPPNTYSAGHEAYCTYCPRKQYQPNVGSKSCLICTSPLQDPNCLTFIVMSGEKFKIMAICGVSFFVAVFLFFLCCHCRKQTVKDKDSKNRRSDNRNTRSTRNQASNVEMQELLPDRNKQSITKLKSSAPPTPPSPDF